jgi:DNA-directed RNA polymerase subunit RPC12/RpoP
MEKEKCKKCGSEKILMVEYPHDHPEHYDGVSEIKCLQCGARFGRWSGKELGLNESEKRGGRK